MASQFAALAATTASKCLVPAGDVLAFRSAVDIACELSPGDIFTGT